MADENSLTLEHLCLKAQSLPGSPLLVAQLYVALNDSEQAAEDIANLIRKDTSLALETLKWANSPFYGGKKVDSLEEALLRLGMREIYKLAVNALALRWLVFPVQGCGWNVQSFLRHSVCLAVAAEILARETYLVSYEQAYTAGLLQDTGRLVMAYVCPETISSVHRLCVEKNCTWCAAERELFGFDYLDVGSRLLQKWDFPRNLIHAQQYAFRLDEAPETAKPLIAVLQAARLVAVAEESCFGMDGILPPINETTLRDFGILPRMIESVTDQAWKLVDQYLDYSAFMKTA